MATVAIRVNGAGAGPLLDAPINTSVVLTNNNNTGVTTWAWSFVNIPVGSAAALSGAATSTASFTPDVEGTYLIRLVVNALSVTPVLGQTEVAVLQLRTRTRVPAVGETVEASSLLGWAGGAPAPTPGVNATLQAIDKWRGNPCVIVGFIAPAETNIAVNKVFYISSRAAIMSGLPGQAWLPQMNLVRATDSASILYKTMCLLLGTIDGAPPTAQSLCLFQLSGPVFDIADIGASAASSIFVGPLGQLQLTPVAGAIKIVGTAISGGANWALMFDPVPAYFGTQMDNVAAIGDVVLNDPSGATQSVVRASTTGDMEVGTQGTGSLYMLVNNSPKWEFKVDGSLSSTNVGAGEQLDNIANPVNNLSAVNKQTMLALKAQGTLMFGNTAMVGTASTTRYLFPGLSSENTSAIDIDIMLPISGVTFTRISVVCEDPYAGGNVVFMLRVNNADTSLTVTLTNGDTDAIDSGSVSANLADKISVKVTTGTGVSSGATNLVVMLAYEATVVS